MRSNASDSDSPAEIAARLEWRTGTASPNGRRVLDVRPGTQSILSASEDEAAALNVLADAPPEAVLHGSPLPEEPVTIAISWPFTAGELARIVQGFRPQAMEDKWRIVTQTSAKGQRVYFLRSWTNILMAVLEIEESSGTTLVAQRSYFQPETTLRAILDGYLFDRSCIVPAPSELGTDKFRLMSWGISSAGRRCDYVEPAETEASA